MSVGDSGSKEPRSLDMLPKLDEKNLLPFPLFWCKLNRALWVAHQKIATFSEASDMQDYEGKLTIDKMVEILAEDRANPE